MLNVPRSEEISWCRVEIVNIETIESRLTAYLEKGWAQRNLKPFLLSYIELLLLFKNELSSTTLSVLVERQKQLRGEEFNSEAFNELRVSVRKQMDRHLRANNDATREALINRMLFCALLDTEESDPFYLIEPIFHFGRAMGVSRDELKQVLESNFRGFKMDG